MGCVQPDDLRRTLLRIDALEADRRRVERSLRRCVPGGCLAGDLAKQRDELDARITHLRAVVARAEAEGMKVWSRDDFTRGDFVQYAGAWYEVLRVNARSLTLPHSPAGAGRDAGGRTWTVGYHDGITGRRSAGEMDMHGL
jgi:hypothetical protein